MATQAEIQAWANGIGLPYCIGYEYQAEHGGQLPPTLDALVTWGNSTGRRNASGEWKCIGVTAPTPTPEPSPTPTPTPTPEPTPTPSPSPSAPDTEQELGTAEDVDREVAELFAKTWTWVSQHMALTAAIVLALWIGPKMLGGRRR